LTVPRRVSPARRGAALHRLHFDPGWGQSPGHRAAAGRPGGAHGRVHV